jgi:hypothetical protein
LCLTSLRETADLHGSLGVVADMHKILTTAVLQAVAVADDLGGSGTLVGCHHGVHECIAAVALVTVLDAGVCPAVRLAVACALLDGQGGAVVVGGAGEGLGGATVVGAAELLEVANFVAWLWTLTIDSVGVSDRVETRLDWANAPSCTLRATIWRVTTRELLEKTLDLLVDEWRLVRTVSVEIRIEGLCSVEGTFGYLNH